MAKKIRPDVLKGDTVRIKTDCGSMYITINLDEVKEVFEVQWRMGKSGHCASVRNCFEYTMLSRLLQSDTPKEIKEFLMSHAVGVNCGRPFDWKGNKYVSCIDLIGKEVIRKMEEGKEEVK